MVSFTWSLPYSTAFNSVPRDFKNQDMVNFSGKQLSETAVYGVYYKIAVQRKFAKYYKNTPCPVPFSKFQEFYLKRPPSKVCSGKFHETNHDKNFPECL